MDEVLPGGLYIHDFSNLHFRQIIASTYVIIWVKIPQNGQFPRQNNRIVKSAEKQMLGLYGIIAITVFMDVLHRKRYTGKNAGGRGEAGWEWPRGNGGA